MATFTIRTNNDHAYSQIMESMIKLSLTHSKTVMQNGTIELEITGSPDNFNFLKHQIDEINLQRKAIVAMINEAF